MGALSTVNEFDSQGLSNIIWSLARWSYNDGPLVASIVSRASSLAVLGEFGSQQLANVSWACAKMFWKDAAFMECLSREAQLKIRDFNVQELSNMSLAFPRWLRKMSN